MDASVQWSDKEWSIFFNVLLISWLLLSDSENNVILGYVPMIFYCHNCISWSENKMVLLLFYISVLNVTQNVIFLQRIVRFNKAANCAEVFICWAWRKSLVVVKIVWRWNSDTSSHCFKVMYWKFQNNAANIAAQVPHYCFWEWIMHAGRESNY